MKTYVAEGVLCDHTCGMFVVSARGIAHARKIVDKLKAEFSDKEKEEIKKSLTLLKAGTYTYEYGGG